MRICTVCEDWANSNVILPSGGRGWEGSVSGCVMAWRLCKALTSRMCHRNGPADPPMKRGQHLSNMSWKSYSWKEIGFTGSARPPHALRLRLLRLAERVANAVTFLTHICASNTSKRLGNGRGVPLFGTYVPGIGTHRSNRLGLAGTLRGLCSLAHGMRKTV